MIGLSTVFYSISSGFLMSIVSIYYLKKLFNITVIFMNTLFIIYSGVFINASFLNSIKWISPLFYIHNAIAYNQIVSLESKS